MDKSIFAKWEFDAETSDRVSLICYRCSNCGCVVEENVKRSLYSSKCPECEAFMEFEEG